MTEAEYDKYRKQIEPFIGNTDLTYDRADVWLTLLGTETYEEGVNEWPKAIFRLSTGGNTTMDLQIALDLLIKPRKG